MLDPIFYGEFPANVEMDLSELQLRSNAVRTQAVVVADEAIVSPNMDGYWFAAEYYVEEKTYRTLFSTTDKELAELYEIEAIRLSVIDGVFLESLAPPIYIIYDSTEPSNHIVGELSGGAPLCFISRSIPLSMVVYLAAIILVSFGIVSIIYSLIKYSPDKEEPRDWFTKEEAEAFIGANSEYYLSKWKGRSESHFKGWNWAAAFFCVEWYAYRKMYLKSAEMLPGLWIGIVPRFIPLAIFFIIGFSQFLPGWLAITISVLISRFIGGGLFGNIHHRDMALEALGETLKMSETERLEYLKSKGGTNAAAPVVAIVVQALIIAALVLPNVK